MSARADLALAAKSCVQADKALTAVSIQGTHQQRTETFSLTSDPIIADPATPTGPTLTLIFNAKENHHGL
jgi:hypothetical protein